MTMTKLISIEREGHGEEGRGAFHMTTVYVLGRPILTYSRGPEDVNIEFSVGLLKLDFYGMRPVGTLLVKFDASGGLVMRGTENHKLVPVPFFNATIDSIIGSLSIEVL